MRGARMLNNVSRSLSDVGRTPSHVGVFKRRPFNEPAITRISDAAGTTKTRRREGRTKNPLYKRSFVRSSWFRGFVIPVPSSDLDQLEALFPAGEQLVEAGGRGVRGLEPPRRLALRDIQELAVANQIDHAERWDAGLSRTEKISRPAQPQIALRDLEAIGRLGHRFQPLARVVGERVLIDQKA